MQELGKCNLKINAIPNALEKYVSLSINKKLRIKSSSLDRLAKLLNKYHFKYLSQEFDNNVLDFVKQKLFYLYEYMSNFEKFKEHLPSKQKFCSLLPGKIITYKV